MEKIPTVNLFLESSYNGPAKKAGEVMYLLEYKKNGIPITRSQILHLDESTENAANLTALATALKRLKCNVKIRINTRCEHILNAEHNGWVDRWKDNGFRTSAGKEIKNAELWKEVTELLDNNEYEFVAGQHEYRTWMQEEIKRGEKRNGEKHPAK